MRLTTTVVAGLTGLAMTLVATSVDGQTRDEKVRNDREQLADDASWHYDNLEQGIQAARDAGKSLMVVLRCIP